MTRLAERLLAAARAGLHVGVQQQLPLGLVRLGRLYAHTYGDHLEIVVDSNLPAPTFQRTYQLPDGSTFTVPFSAGCRARRRCDGERERGAARTAVGRDQHQQSHGESWYNGLLVDLRRRFSPGHAVQWRVHVGEGGKYWRATTTAAARLGRPLSTAALPPTSSTLSRTAA